MFDILLFKYFPPWAPGTKELVHFYDFLAYFLWNTE